MAWDLEECKLQRVLPTTRVRKPGSWVPSGTRLGRVCHVKNKKQVGALLVSLCSHPKKGSPKERRAHLETKNDQLFCACPDHAHHVSRAGDILTGKAVDKKAPLRQLLEGERLNPGKWMGVSPKSSVRGMSGKPREKKRRPPHGINFQRNNLIGLEALPLARFGLSAPSLAESPH